MRKFTLQDQTQNGSLLRYLAHHPEGISVKRAGAELGILCLHKRIAELRADGWQIDSTTRDVGIDRHGYRYCVAVHRLQSPMHADDYGLKEC